MGRMAPMKAMKAAAMKATKGPMKKGALLEAIAGECELKRKQASQILESLGRIATEQVKSNGVFTIPGLARIKTRRKPATKAGKREIFGKVMMVKAKPAKTVVKAFPVAALKKNF